MRVIELVLVLQIDLALSSNCESLLVELLVHDECVSVLFYFRDDVLRTGLFFCRTDSANSAPNQLTTLPCVRAADPRPNSNFF